MRKTKIVCTIGPSSESAEMIEKLCIAGMNVARLNFSHGNHKEHKHKGDEDGMQKAFVFVFHLFSMLGGRSFRIVVCFLQAGE